MSWMNNKISEKDQLYYPVNKEKYMGKTEWSVCRSSWETAVCKWCDMNPAVLQWSTEQVVVPYIDPASKDYKGMPKKRSYYPDFLMKIKSKSGGIEVWMVEVKPYKETIPPKKGTKKKTSTLLYEEKTWTTNQAKWRAAQAFCERKGWKFRILTEKDLKI